MGAARESFGGTWLGVDWRSRGVSKIVDFMDRQLQFELDIARTDTRLEEVSSVAFAIEQEDHSQSTTFFLFYLELMKQTRMNRWTQEEQLFKAQGHFGVGGRTD